MSAPTCVECGGPLPPFPAYLVTGKDTHGPLCDMHAVVGACELCGGKGVRKFDSDGYEPCPCRFP